MEGKRDKAWGSKVRRKGERKKGQMKAEAGREKKLKEPKSGWWTCPNFDFRLEGIEAIVTTYIPYVEDEHNLIHILQSAVNGKDCF